MAGARAQVVQSYDEPVFYEAWLEDDTETDRVAMFPVWAPEAFAAPGPRPRARPAVARAAQISPPCA